MWYWGNGMGVQLSQCWCEWVSISPIVDSGGHSDNHYVVFTHAFNTCVRGCMQNTLCVAMSVDCAVCVPLACCETHCLWQTEGLS